MTGLVAHTVCGDGEQMWLRMRPCLSPHEMFHRAGRLLALGLSVIPLEGKEPDCTVLPLGENGKPVWGPYQSRKPTDAELENWFGNGIHRNIGIVLSDLLVVVESDKPEAEAWCAANLPLTPMMTRSARGYHRYFLRSPTLEHVPASIKVGALEIEVKRAGQYVVGPGSVHPGKLEEGILPGHIYAEVEPWPTDIRVLPFLPPSLFGDAATGKREPAPPLPETVASGSRNTLLYREGCRLRRLGWKEAEIATALIGINRSRCHPRLDDAEVAKIAHSCAKHQPASDSYPVTETGDAEFFAALYADDVRFDHRANRWLVFEHHHWLPDGNGTLDRLALLAMRERQRLALDVTDTAEKKRRGLWAFRGEERKRLTNLLALARTKVPLADKGDEWDVNPWLLGVQNGVLDLRTGTLRDGRPNDRITKVAPVVFDPGALCPRWDRFVREVFGGYDDLPVYMQRVLGYALTGEIGEQVFWLLWGEGANGKTTFLETFTHTVLGTSYAWTMPFPAAGWTNAMSEYHRACLDGPRLFQASEVKIRGELNEELVKQITGGDELSGRHPCGRPFSFRPVGKLFLRVNHKPVIRDQSHAMWRRVKMVPFTHRFSIDSTLADKLAAEAPGILAWAVRGCLDWQENGLQHPKTVEEATIGYKAESDPFLRFIQEACVTTTGARVRASELFAAYQRWCLAVGETGGLNAKTFGERVKGHFSEKRDKTGVWYQGVGLLSSEW